MLEWGNRSRRPDASLRLAARLANATTSAPLVRTCTNCYYYDRYPPCPNSAAARVSATAATVVQMSLCTAALRVLQPRPPSLVPAAPPDITTIPPLPKFRGRPCFSRARDCIGRGEHLPLARAARRMQLTRPPSITVPMPLPHCGVCHIDISQDIAYSI